MNMKTKLTTWIVGIAAFVLVPGGAHAAFSPKTMTAESIACVACHKNESVSIYEQWGTSKHYRGNVGCFECHTANENDPDAFEHYGQFIATIVSPKDCARCHEKEVKEFNDSHHAKGGRILGSLDNTLAEVVEGNNAFVTPAFPHGVSAAAVNRNRNSVMAGP